MVIPFDVLGRSYDFKPEVAKIIILIDMWVDILKNFLFILVIFILVIGQTMFLLRSAEKGITPFTLKNAGRLRMIACVIMVFPLFADNLFQLLISIFFTHTCNPNLNGIFTGLLIGGPVLVIAEIFKYGVYLQAEYDATL